MSGNSKSFHPPGNDLVGKEDLIEWMGIKLTEERLRQLAHKGFFPPAKRGKYQFQATVSGLMRYYAEANSNTSEAMRRIKLQREEQRLEREKIDTAKATDAVIHRDAAIRAVSRFVIRLKFLLLNMPRNLGPRMAVETDPLTCEELIAKGMREAFIKVRDEFELGKPKFECPRCQKKMPI